MSAYRDDASLLVRCRGGDAAAWELLVARYRRLVWSVVLKHRLSDESREDAFAQTFAALVEHLDGIRDEEALPSWLITTAQRACWRLAAKERRDRPTASLDAEGPDGASMPAPADDDAIDPQALAERQLVREGLERLGGKCKELLEALFGAGRDPNYTGLAERLGMRIGSIGPTRARCLEKLAGVLARLGFGDPDDDGTHPAGGGVEK
jgi:RNA polymerase sigma factor (sigma-70 family)